MALRYHNVYGPRMPRDTPYSGVAAMFRSSLERGEAPQVFEDGGQMRDFVHVDDVARANVLALESVVAEPARPLRRLQRLLRPAGVDPRRRDRGSPRAPDATSHPQVTGGFRPGDVRHVVASPDRAARELGFTAAVAPRRRPARLRHGAAAGLTRRVRSPRRHVASALDSPVV